MDARLDILKKHGITPATKHHSYQYLFKAVLCAMEEYHTLKSEEEANEKLKEARQYIHHNGHNPYHVDKAIRIASGVKESD